MVAHAYKATETTERARTMMKAWSGGPLTVDQIAKLTGLPKTKALHNSMEYLCRSGVCVRIARGTYQPSI